jgi:hypothetical protein
MPNLLTQNWLAAGAHLFSGILVLVLYNYWSVTKNYARAETYRYQLAGPNTNAQCTTTGLPPVTPDQCETEIVFQQPKGIAKWNVIYGVLIFFFFTAFAHVFYATNAFGTGAYLNNIMEGWNPYRWIEYAISASIMTFLIGLVDGTRDTSTLIGLVLLTAALQLNGFTVEATLKQRGTLNASSREAVLGSTVSGWLLFVALWFVLIWGFASLVSDVSTLYPGTASVPAWIWFVVIAQLLFYASFGIVQVIHISRRFNNSKSNYASIESYYIMLSFAAKLALAGGIGYGLLFRVKDCPP